MAQVFDTEQETLNIPTVDVQEPTPLKVQEPAPELAILQDPPSKELWAKLSSKEYGELYTKSYDEFKKKYSTPEAIAQLHTTLSSPDYQFYTKGSDEFTNKYFPELKKKEAPIQTVPLETPQDFSDGSQVGASNGTTPTTEPAIVPPSAEPTNPIDILLDAKSNINKTIRSSSTDAMGNIFEIDFPDEEANKKGKASLDKLKAQKIDTEDLYNQIKDLPKEVYDIKVQKADGTIDTPYSKERLSQEYIDSPVSFSYKMDAIKNRLTLKKAASELTAAGTPTDGAALGEYYNRLGDAVPTMQKWEENQQKRVDLINQYLVGEEKTIALQRAKNSASSFYNPDNIAIITEYDASPLKSKIDISQFAALQSIKVFQPDQYKQALSLINFDPKVQTEDKDGISFVQQSPNLSAPNKSETVESINIRKGKEKILKDLSEAGRNNAISVIQYQNELIAKNIKQVPPDQSSDLINQYNSGAAELKKLTDRNAELKTQIEETLGQFKNPLIKEYNDNIAKSNSISQGINALAEQIKQIPDSPLPGLIQKYNDNIEKIKNIQNDTKNDDTKYPLLADQKYDQLVKDFMGQSGYSALVGGLGAVGTDMYKTGRTLVESTLAGSLTAGYLGKISSSLAGYNPLGDVARQARALGETLTTEADFYRPPNQQAEEPLFINKFDKPLADQLNAVIKGRDLRDLSAAEKGVLKNIIKDNSAQVHTITNPKFGKSKNFLSISTVYDNVHAIGTIVSFAIQAGLLKGAGMGSAMASAIPLFTTSKQDFYKEAVEKGMPNPDEYANVHASIMFLAGFVSPRLDVLKKIVGIESEAGVLLNGISDKTWNSVINKNQGLLNRITNSASNVASTTAHMVGVFGAGTSIAGNLANIGIYSEQKGIGQVLDEAYDASKHIVSDMAALTALGAITNFKSTSTEQKARLWELGNNKKNNIIAIEEDLANNKISAQEAEDRKKIVNEVQDIISKMPTKNAKGGLMTDSERLNYFYNLLTQKKIKTEEAVLPEAQKEKLNYVSMVTDHLNNLIIDPKDPKELEKRKIELQKILTPKPDKEGKLIELNPKVELNTLAELEAINKHLEDKEAELAPTLTPEEILSGKIAEKTPTEIGGYKVVGEETPVGGERVFKVVDENGTERFLTADGKELKTAKVEVPAETTTAEVATAEPIITGIDEPELIRQAMPTAQRMVDIEREFENKGYKIDTIEDNEIQIMDKDGELVETPEDLPKELRGLAADYEAATAKLGDVSDVVREKALAESRKVTDVEAEVIEPEKKQIGVSAEVPQPTLQEQSIAEVSKQQLEETNNLLNDGDKIRTEGKYVKDGVEYVRNEKGLGVKSEKGGDVRFTSEPGGGGVSVPFKYKIVEAETLQPSHQDGIRNPNHFIWEAQPKNRNDVGSIQAEESFADNPRFEEMGENTNAYSGAPVVNERNEVIQGNNRSAGLRKGYQRGNEIYKKALSEKAEKFGFSKEQVNEMKNPVLVREVATSDKGAIELGNYDVKDLESGGKRRLDPIALTRRMSFEVKGRIADILFKGDETLNQAIRTNTKRLMELIDPYLNQSQRNTILKDGNLTDAGIKDLEAVVQHFLFDGGDSALPDLYENLSGTQKEALRKSLPYIFSTGTQKSIVSEVQEAIIALNDFGASGVDNFDNWLPQSDMFNDGMTPRDKYSPTSIKIAEILYNAKTQKEVIAQFGQYAEAVNDKPATMFEGATKGISKKEGIKQIFKTEYDENKRSQISQGSSEKILGTKKEKSQSLGEKSTKPAEETKPELESQKTLADKFRGLKSKGGKGYESTLGIPIAIWDGSMELIAKSIEAGISIKEAIEKGIVYIKSNYKGKLDDQALRDNLNKINEPTEKIKTERVREASKTLKYNTGEKQGIPYLSESSNADYSTGEGGVQGEVGKISQSIVGIWGKDKNLQFTGTTKVKNAADVAHIMQLLENKTVEHAFAVHIDENGDSHIQFLSIGGVAATVVDPKIVLAGAKKFKSVRTFLIHNHPSGNMTPSGADLNITAKIRAGLEPLGITVEHIIMDTFSKEYIHIDQLNEPKVYKRDQGIQDNVKLSAYSMNEMMIFSEPIVKVRGADDAVNFLQQLRFTAMPKNGMLLLDHGNNIIGNYVFKGEIDYKQTTSFIGESGTGSNVIFYGNNFDKALILGMKDNLSKLDIGVLDHIVTSSDLTAVNQYYESMMEAGRLSETQAKYGTNIVNEVGADQGKAEVPQQKGVEKGNFVKDKNGNYYPTNADLPKGFTILETADSDPGYGRLFDNFGYGIMEGSIEDIAKELRDSYPIGTSAIKDGTNLDLYSNIDKFTLKQFETILQNLDPKGEWDTMVKEVDGQPNEYKAKKLETELLAESRAKLKEYVTDMLKSDKADEYIGFDIPKDGLGKTELPQPITEPKTETERKTIADQIRQLKSGKGKAYDAVLGIPVAIWDGAIELAAKAAETTEDIVKIVKAGIDHIKESDWYKNLNQNEQKITEQNFADISQRLLNGEEVDYKTLITDYIVDEEEWTSIAQVKLKEIDSIKQLFEKEVGTTWSTIQQSALEDIQKRFPKKTLADAIATRVQELAMKYDVEGQDSYNPTAKDLAVIQEYIRQTNRKLRDVKEDLSSDNDIERQVAILNIEGLNNDLLNAGKASFKREAGTAFGFRASESRLDINNGLEIRRAQLMRANEGEKLSATDEQWVKDQWEKEKALIIKEQEIREKGLKDEFDRKIAQLQKEFDDKLKSTKPKVPLTERKKTLSQKGKNIADQIRKFKLTGTKSDFTLGSWNSAIEGIALLCEKGATILEAIDDLIKSKQLGFKTNEDRAKFEDNLADHLNNFGKRDTSLEKIKAMAAQSGSNTITNEMVVAGAIKDYVNSHIGEFDKTEILDKSLEGLKKIFPNLDKNTLRRAFLKLDEFKQDSKRDIEKRLAQEARELKRLFIKEAKQVATQTEEQARKLEEEKQSTLRKIKEFKRKLKEEEFEKEPPIVLKKQDAELIQLNKEKYTAESEFRKKQTELQEKNKHWAERMADTIRSTMIAKLIGSPVTLAKVAYMSFIRPTGETIRKGGMGLIFDAFFPSISKAAEKGGESSSLTALAKGWQAYFINVGQARIEAKFKKASENYDQAAKAYYDALGANADAKTLKKLEKNMNEALVKATGNIIYQFIGSSSLKDSFQSLVNRSNEIEKQFGKVDIESIKDGNAIDKLNYVIGFIGRSHSAAKTFSGRFSYAVSFMTRLEAAARDGSLSDPNRVIEIAHESYIDWERGKYQQQNWVTETWNNIISGITRKNAEHPSWDTYNKALAAGTKTEVAITRVPVNILHEALVEYTLGAFKAPLLAFKEYSKAKKQTVIEGYSKMLDSAEFKARVKEIVGSMDQAQAARIFRLFTKGTLGLGLYGLTLYWGLMHFGVYQHKGQKKKKEEDLLEEGELNPGQVMLGKTRMGETASKLIEHTPSLWTTFMGLGLAKIYSDDVMSGKMTSQAAWDAFYTHLQIIEGSIPQAKVLGPLEVGKNIGKQLGGVASTFGMFDTYIDGKGNWINREKEALVITSPEVLKLKEYKVAPPELGVRKMYKLQVDGTHPKVGASKDGVAYALMNDFEWQKFNDYRKEYINTSLAELYRAADTDLPKIGGGTVKEIILNKENLTDALSTIVRQASVIAKSRMIDEKLLPEKNEDKEEDLNVQDIKDIINDFYEEKKP